MAFQDSLNGYNLLTTFSMVIQTGLANFLEFPERKTPLSNDWQDEDGIEYDLQNPTFKDKEITLNCAIMADNNIQFWTYYNLLWAELKKPNRLSLYIDDHSKTYQVFYKKSGNFKLQTKRLKNVPKVFVKFTLTFQF